MKKYQYNITHVQLNQLTFDINNPRIPKSLNKENDNSILEWMINKENVIDLMYSIGEKNFFPGEPLLVIFDESKGKYISIEGNRRYTASFLLQFPEMAPVRKSAINEISLSAKYRPTELPVVIFKTREEITDYLGYKHITGVEPWDALAKARYLRVLYDRLDSELSVQEKYKTLSRQIGSTSSYVRQILIGSQLVDVIESRNYFDIFDLNDQTFEFGSFYTAIVKPNIAGYLGIKITEENALKDLNIDHLCDLLKWMFEKNSENQTRLGESRNLTRLNKILDPRYSKALEVFKKGAPLSKAAELTDEADEIIRKKIDESLKAIEIAWSYFPSLKEYDSINQDQLKQISKIVAAFYRSLLAKISLTSELEDL